MLGIIHKDVIVTIPDENRVSYLASDDVADGDFVTFSLDASGCAIDVEKAEFYRVGIV